MSTAHPLTFRQMDLFLLLDGKGDVSIPDLYQGYYKRAPKVRGHATVAQMQKALGWPIVSLNSKLRPLKQRVVPGEARQSYRLIAVD